MNSENANSESERNDNENDLAPETVAAEWSQADTPGSGVKLYREPKAAEEETTRIAEVSGPDQSVDTTDLSAIGSEADSKDETPYSPRRLVDVQDGDLEAEALAVEEARLVEQQRAWAAAEAARLESERIAQERATRDRALGVVASSGTTIQAAPPTPKLVTDKFVGALGLFVFRIVIAGVLAVHGYQAITDISNLQSAIEPTPLPEPGVLAWVGAISTLAIALALLTGMLVRVAGFGLLTLMVLALAFLKWGPFQIFLPTGFHGELELLLAGAGLLFLCLGGGRWGIDGSFRAARQKAKAEATP